jgi:single-strand DNA-binding protein
LALYFGPSGLRWENKEYGIAYLRFATQVTGRGGIMYQQIMLMGNLGNDPEMRYTPSGIPVTSFSLAVNKSWVSQDGQRQDKTIWFRVTAWRKTAETVSQYLTKGQRVLVVGEIEEARAYTDRDGNMRASLEVTAQTIKFLGSRNEAAGGHEATNYGGPGAAPAAEGQELRDEDIPF